MRFALKTFLVVLLLGGPGYLLWLEAKTPPIPLGTPSEYFGVLCGTQPDELPARFRRASSVGVYPARDGWLYYYAQEHHGQPIYRVRASDVVAELPQLRPSPSKPSVENCDDKGWPDVVWCEHSAERRAACDAAFHDSVPSSTALMVMHDSFAADAIGLDGFDDRLRRADLHGATVAFEAFLIVSWHLFVLWPWLRSSTARRKRLHLLFAPLVLFLPYYLGYAPLTFTFGPSGGFVYPLYLILASAPLALVPCNAVDIAVLNALPPFLSTITQLSGPPMAVTFFGCVGPTACLLLGLVGATAHFVVQQVLSVLGPRRLARASA